MQKKECNVVSEAVLVLRQAHGGLTQMALGSTRLCILQRAKSKLYLLRREPLWSSSMYWKTLIRLSCISWNNSLQ